MKSHQLTDGRNRSLVSRLTPGQAGAIPMLLPSLSELRVSHP